jgi:uncharacterized repeat protein (TIGR03803 family)
MQRRSVVCGIHPQRPSGALILAFVLISLVTTQVVHAQTFSVLYSFQNTTDGSNAQAGLFLNGAIYGTTYVGGESTCVCGTIFQFSNGTLTTLYTFAGTNGANPAGSLIADTKGNLYGTTSQGGSGSAGAVFELSPPATQGGAWTETVLYSFTGGADGGHPYAGLIQDSAGNFYGTTNSGGASNYGTVFKLSTTGSETVLHSFSGSPDGAYPYAALIWDSAGNLYGTTYSGGAFNAGTVFKLSTAGVETLLHSLNGTTDGANSSSTLTMDSAGNLYGAANQGGSDQEGTIFKLSSAGHFSLLHTFSSRAHGANPAAGMLLGSNGILYGTTTEGGDSDDDGTIFELTTTGTFTLLHTFASGHFGNYPYTGLISDPSGNLYGATESGGTSQRGLIYEIAVTGAGSRGGH